MKKVIIISAIFFTTMCIVPDDLQTISDGNNPNQAPRILNYSPEAHVISVNLTDTDSKGEVDFSIDAVDPDGDFLSYKWEVLDCNNFSCKVSIEPIDDKSYKYIASLPARDLFIGVEVSDRVNNVYHYWILKIQQEIF